MQNFISVAKKTLFLSATVLLLNLPAAAVSADDAPVCSPPPVTQAGVRWPTGSDSGTFTYQCDGDYAGMWINDYYIYDPATNTRTPRYDLSYHYDCTAQQWYMTEWDYSPAADAYQQNTVQTTAPAGVATGCPVAPVVDPTKTVDTNGDGILDSPTTPQTLAAAKANGGSAINLDGSANLNFSSGTTATITNGILSFASTGDASVVGNTTGGSATSGNAQAIANIINLLQSSSNILGTPNMLTFTANINGDVNGDLLLDPAQLGAVQPANVSTTLDNNVAVNTATNTGINNTVYLDAASGNATVARNTTGGDATTGTADAVANIVNILNSAVTAGRSFMGVININGDLNGDILLPPNFVDTLLASNVPHYTVNTADISSNQTVGASNTSTINNAVTADAQSGSAVVSNNTSAGNATSGLANTNLTVFNLTGNNVVATNDLLVFVNVLGTWYGMIMNAPAGTTAASLGGGVNSNTTLNNTATVNVNATQSINNTVHANATSGDASVTSNTSGGNATSGNATASVNILNMINNSLSLNGWFGLLFINVFGTWNGSFGINTSAGDPIIPPAGNSSGGSSAPMFQFVSAVPGGSNSHATYSSAAANDNSTGDPSTHSAVLAASSVKKAVTAGLPSSTASNPTTNQFVLPLLAGAFGLVLLAAGERGGRILRR